MKDLEFMRKIGGAVLAVFVLGSFVLALSYYLECRAADRVLQTAEKELAALSLSLFGGYDTESEQTEWIDPVLSVEDHVVIDGESRRLGDWLNEAGSSYREAFSRFEERQNYKCSLLAGHARRIYAQLNARAAIERAEQELTAASLNVFGGYLGSEGSADWVKPAYGMDQPVTLSNTCLSMRDWLYRAGMELSRAYDCMNSGQSDTAVAHALRANEIYEGLNRKVRQNTAFWRLNPLAMRE